MLQDLLPLEQLDNAKWSLKHVYLFKVRVQVCDNSMIGLVFCSVVNVESRLAVTVDIKDLGKVQKVAWDARTEWYNIGLELNIDADTLDVIEDDKKGIEDRFRAMLKTWLRTVQPKPTLEALAEALRSPTVGYGHLAEQILALK